MRIQSLFKFFLKGLILVAPLGITTYVIVEMVRWTDNLLPINIPGLGILTVFVVTAVIGYLANTLFAKPFFDLFNDLIKRIPLVSFLYTSINDLVSAFAGDKKKFDAPVLVVFDEGGKIYKPGFVTQDDLTALGLPGMATVYMPHSYNFSGNVIIVEKSRLIPFNANSTEVMKYIVSGGVSGELKPRK